MIRKLTFMSKISLLLIMFLFSINCFASSEKFKLADEAFMKRADIEKSFTAHQLYQKLYEESPDDFEAGWRLAMASYFIGIRHCKDSSKKSEIYAQGRDAGLASIKLKPNCAPCHFWTAINMALYGESVGIFKMLFTLDEIQEHLKKSIVIDPTYANSGGYRLMGAIKQKLPGILGGSNREAKEYFEKAIQTSPDEPLNYLFLSTLYRENFNELKKSMELASKGVMVPEPSSDRLESIEALAELKKQITEYPKEAL